VTGKALIVNADDLGRMAGINRGIFEAHRKGIVTSASLMVNHPAARDVPRLSEESPQLGIGLHVALTGGPSALPVERIRSLTAGRPLLPSKPEGLAGADPAEVLAETRAQLRRFREILGREPTHLDLHHHTHTIPAVVDALVTLSWETGLPVRAASPAMRERLRREGIHTPDRFADGFYGDGATEERLVGILEDVPLGVTELMCHPAVVDDELRSTSSYSEERGRELRILTSPLVRQTLQALGIRLIHYGQLPPPAARYSEVV
jgi:predicted glycoside hydrolase/deacetylase ChbG (UPF0249 family)